MRDDVAILRGAACPVPEHGSFASSIAQMVREYPLRTVVEIGRGNAVRTLPVRTIWLKSAAMIERLQLAPPAPRPVLVVCLDSFLDLIAAGWAAVVMDRDCYYWHVIDGHESSRNFTAHWRELRTTLGECQLITRSRLLREFRVDWPSEPWPPVCLDRLPEATSDHHDLFDRDHDHGKVLVRTSGTTGTGKLAMLPYTVMRARNLSAQLVQRDFINLSAVPMDNITGISSQILNANLRVLINPATVAIDPLTFLSAIESFGVEQFVVTTSFASRLIRVLQQLEAPLDLHSLRNLSVGLEPIATRVIVQLLKELRRHGAGDVRASFGYGLTEVGRAAFSLDLSLDELRSHSEQSPGAFPLANCALGRAIRVVDGTGRPLGKGQEGEVQIYAPQRTIDGYLGSDGAVVPVKQVDGWVCSGDIGQIVDRGLVITGRTKGIIFSNGKCIALDPVEQMLRDSGMVREGLVGATPLESEEEAGDYIVLYCPAQGRESTDNIERVRQLATSAIGVRPARVVPLTPDRFVFTTTGKMRKRHMARLHGRDVTASPATPPAPSEVDNDEGDPLFAELCRIWSSILDLRGADPQGRTFFELGGSSITAVEFLHRAEQLLRVRLPAERFFADPTLRQVWRIFRQDGLADLDDPVEAGYCLDRLEAHVRDWQGQKASDHALLRGFPTGGDKTPIFWVFQMEQELLGLAAEVGADQPLYGMRSLHNILPVRRLSDSVLREVSNQYITELLAITQGKPFVLGGNCQGAIVALQMALALRRLGSTPATLVLMEWTYSWGRYAEPVVLLYGNRSHTAKIYGSPDGCGLPWRNDFPQAVTHPIKGGHGEFFNAENISSLGGQLLALTRNV
jgi:acyl-coenzyme A synthetase/AMP-(fatty) acid ligase